MSDEAAEFGKALRAKVDAAAATVAERIARETTDSRFEVLGKRIDVWAREAAAHETRERIAAAKGDLIEKLALATGQAQSRADAIDRQFAELRKTVEGIDASGLELRVAKAMSLEARARVRLRMSEDQMARTVDLVEKTAVELQNLRGDVAKAAIDAAEAAVLEMEDRIGKAQPVEVKEPAPVRESYIKGEVVKAGEERIFLGMVWKANRDTTAAPGFTFGKNADWDLQVMEPAMAPAPTAPHGYIEDNSAGQMIYVDSIAPHVIVGTAMMHDADGRFLFCPYSMDYPMGPGAFIEAYSITEELGDQAAPSVCSDTGKLREQDGWAWSEVPALQGSVSTYRIEVVQTGGLSRATVDARFRSAGNGALTRSSLTLVWDASRGSMEKFTLTGGAGKAEFRSRRQ